jgi:hypothetical protein
VSHTTTILCHGDERLAGCGEIIALVIRDQLVRAGGGDILSFDRLGRARIACRCGAITMTQGRPLPVPVKTFG